MSKGNADDPPHENPFEPVEQEVPVEAVATDELKVEQVEPAGRRGHIIELIITGDNFREGLTVTAGDQVLQPDIVSPHELHVDLPDEVLKDGGAHLVIGSDQGMVRADFGIVDNATGFEGLAGDGDTDY
jgi:hypothetical protein